MAAPGTFVANGSHGTLTARDATPTTPLEKVLDFENGDISITGLANVLREVVKYERRGRLHGVGLGARTYPQLTFTATLAEWTNNASGEGTLLDLVKAKAGGDYAARIGTLGADHPVICLDLEYKFTDFAAADHDFTLHDCHITWDFSEGDPSTLSFTAEVLGEISGDLTADET